MRQLEGGYRELHSAKGPTDTAHPFKQFHWCRRDRTSASRCPKDQTTVSIAPLQACTDASVADGFHLSLFRTNPEAFRGRGVFRIVADEGFALYRGAGWTAARNAPGSFAVSIICVAGNA